MKIAICVVCYNRLTSLKRVLSSLEIAYYDDPVTLIISIDKSNTSAVEDFADQYKWEHGELRVVKHEQNLGLRRHILSVGDHLKDFDAIVVLEDDIYVAPSFYYYTKQCVEKYHNDLEIAGISLYNFPLNYHNKLPFTQTKTNSDVFLLQSACSWGQVWMRDQWFAFRNWYEQNNEDFNLLPHLPKSICLWPKSSWLKYHIKYCIEENKYFIFPYVSLSTCFGDVGVHAKNKATQAQVLMNYDKQEVFNLNPKVLYDGFFEAKSIYKHLGLDEEHLCVDFYGEKNNREHRRYWLTQQQLSYKILTSYSLDFKPWEQNVLHDNFGEELFLYDTTISAKNKHYKDNLRNREFYLYSTYIDLYNVSYKALFHFLLNVKHRLFGFKKKNK